MKLTRKSQLSRDYGLKICRPTAVYYLTFEYGIRKAVEMLRTLERHPDGLLYLLPVPQFMQPYNAKKSEWKKAALTFYDRVMATAHERKGRVRSRFGLSVYLPRTLN